MYGTIQLSDHTGKPFAIRTKCKTTVQDRFAAHDWVSIQENCARNTIQSRRACGSLTIGTKRKIDSHAWKALPTNAINYPKPITTFAGSIGQSTSVRAEEKASRIDRLIVFPTHAIHEHAEPARLQILRNAGDPRSVWGNRRTKSSL